MAFAECQQTETKNIHLDRDVHTFVRIVIAQQAVGELSILGVVKKLLNSWDGLGWHHFLDRWHCLNGSTTTVIILNVSFNIENTFNLSS